MASAAQRNVNKASLQPLWQRIRARLESEGSLSHAACWLNNARLDSDPQGGYVLECSDGFSKKWIQDRYQDVLQELLRAETGADVALSFSVAADIDPAEPTEKPETCPTGSDPQDRASPTPGHLSPPGESKDPGKPFPGWNPRFTFETFIVGASNRFAWAAAQEVCMSCRRDFNPLLVQGPTGLGKTHIGHATAQALHARNPALRIRYCTVESLFADLIAHIRGRDVLSFKEKYRRDCDVLILDDLQFACGKEALQAEIAYMLDSLASRGSQVVLLGDLDSNRQAALQDSLRSRAFSGLAVTVGPPDFETRMAILRQAASLSQAEIPQATLEVLADLVRSNVRELEAALRKVLAAHRLSNAPLDPDGVREILGDFPTGLPTALTMREIVAHVCRYFQIDPDTLTAKSKKRSLVYPRQLAIYLIRKYTDEPLHSIGALFGRDHSSILYAARAFEKKLSSSPRARREADFVEEQLRVRTR